MYSRKVSFKDKTIKLKTLSNKDSEGVGCRLLSSCELQVSFLFPGLFENYVMNRPDTKNITRVRSGRSGSSLAYWKPVT